jgi:hypothetical protein
MVLDTLQQLLLVIVLLMTKPRMPHLPLHHNLCRHI